MSRWVIELALIKFEPSQTRIQQAHYAKSEEASDGRINFAGKGRRFVVSVKLQLELSCGMPRPRDLSLISPVYGCPSIAVVCQRSQRTSMSTKVASKRMTHKLTKFKTTFNGRALSNLQQFAAVRRGASNDRFVVDDLLTIKPFVFGDCQRPKILVARPQTGQEIF